MVKHFWTIATSVTVTMVMAIAMTSTMVSTAAVASPAAPGGGGDNPFPLDYPLPFPWNTIEGVWVVENRSYQAFFSFQVQNDCNGRQILTILEIEPATNRIIAEGIGYKLARTQQVTAAMTGVGGSYMLYVGAFVDTHSTPPKKVNVLRIVPFSGAALEIRFKMKQIGKKIAFRAPDQPSTCLR